MRIRAKRSKLLLFKPFMGKLWGMDEAEINEEYSRTKFRLDVDDPELECVTNLIYYGFLLINHANKSNRHQLSREFDKHYFTAIKFFESCATRGNTPQDRVALVKDGAAWVNDVKRWVRGGLFGRFEPNRIDYLYEQQGALIARCKIMAFILLDEMKKKIIAVLDKQADLAKKDLTETKQNATPAKPERESWWWRFYEITIKVVIDAVLKMLRQS